MIKSNQLQDDNDQNSQDNAHHDAQSMGNASTVPLPPPNLPPLSINQHNTDAAWL